MTILEGRNVDIQTINEYKQLKEELSKRHLSSEDPGKLVRVLDNIKQYRYDPKKIVAEFSKSQRPHQAKTLPQTLVLMLHHPRKSI